MDTLVPIVKYIFVLAVGVEVALILRALITLAREKSRAADLPAQIAEE